jgi:predicted  nucleic acid-binding Zn-ribbon protein
MHVTAKLFKVFQVEKQLRGLQSRLRSAESFLSQQSKELQQIDTKRSTLDGQLKTLVAQASNNQGEVARLDAKLAAIREQMNSAQTNKEYQAFLTEVNNYKADRDRAETAALEQLAKVDEFKAQMAELDGKRGERDQVRTVAASDRDARAREIETQLRELKAKREELAADVPPEALATLNRLLTQRGEEAMASVEIQDRKRHEYTCGSCQMSLPVDAVNGLLTNGKITMCSSCQCLLFLDEEAMRALQPPPAASRR